MVRRYVAATEPSTSPLGRAISRQAVPRWSSVYRPSASTSEPGQTVPFPGSSSPLLAPDGLRKWGLPLRPAGTVVNVVVGETIVEGDRRA